MLTRIIAAALLVLVAVPVLAGPSYEERSQARTSQAASVSQTKDAQAQKREAQGATPIPVACTCSHARS